MNKGAEVAKAENEKAQAEKKAKEAGPGGETNK